MGARRLARHSRANMCACKCLQAKAHQKLMEKGCNSTSPARGAAHARTSVPSAGPSARSAARAHDSSMAAV